MKIAILSDIHGNDIALKSVLKEIDQSDVDKVLCLGDYVGYYYNVDTVLELLDKYDHEMIKGNHEVFLEKSMGNSEESVRIKKMYGSGIEYAKKKLSVERINYLINLPEKKELEFDGLRLLICHGSPWDVSEYIYFDSPEERKNKCFELNQDFVFIGHVHRSFIYQKGSQALVSVGSVGQNRNVGGIASWGLLDTDIKTCFIKETPYDTSNLIKQVKNIDPDNKYLVNVLNRK